MRKSTYGEDLEELESFLPPSFLPTRGKYDPFPTTNIPDPPAKRVKYLSEEVCKNKCTEDQGCKMFQYTGSLCYLAYKGKESLTKPLIHGSNTWHIKQV